MAIYHYQNSGVIDRIEVKSLRPGISQATIITQENADPEKLEQLRKALGSHKISTLMDNVEGRAAIQVRGIKEEKELLATLGKIGLSPAGHAKKELTDNDRKKYSVKDRVRGKAMFLSSIFYDIGNAAFVVSGIQRGRHNPDGKFTRNDISELMIGVTFGLGDVLMTIYGHDKGDEELSAAAAGLKRHLHKKGIAVPEGDELNPDSLHQSGAAKTADRWLRKNIGRVKCMTETVAGLFTIHAALKPDKLGKKNPSKIAGGFIITAGWLATFLLDKPRGHSVFGGDKPDPSTAAEIVADNPRGWIARPAAMLNNVMGGLWGALNTKDGERVRFGKEVTDAQEALGKIRGTSDTTAIKAAEKHLAYTKVKQHDYSWNVVSACSFLIANMLFGLSGSKRPKDTEDDKSMMNDLVLLSANVLARQPEQVREANIDEMAEYVSHLAHVNLPKDQVAKAIHDKVDALSRSNWVARVQAPAAEGPQVGV